MDSDTTALQALANRQDTLHSMDGNIISDNRAAAMDGDMQYTTEVVQCNNTPLVVISLEQTIRRPELHKEF